LGECLKTGKLPRTLVKERGLVQVTDRSALRAEALAVIQEQAQAVSDYRKGKGQALNFLAGQLMRRTKGAASPTISQEILRELLEEKKPA